RQLADRLWPLASYVLYQRERQGQSQVELPGIECQHRRRRVLDDRIFDAVEVGPVLFPIIGIAGDLDPLVRLELDEFEWASADRLRAHVARRYVAGVDRREPGSEQYDKSRLRPPQMKGDLIVAVSGDLFEVAVPGLTRIETKFVSRLAGQQVPGAFDVLGGERLAVVPGDALAQWKSQLGSILVPRPAGGEIRHHRLQRVL